MGSYLVDNGSLTDLLLLGGGVVLLPAWLVRTGGLPRSGVAHQQTFLKDLDAVLGAPLKLEDVEPGRYDVVFLIGGHGPMQDLAVHPTIGDLLAANLDDSTKFVGGVCHGSAGFLSAGRRYLAVQGGESSPPSPTRKRRRRPSPATRPGFSKTACVWRVPSSRRRPRGRRT